MRAPRRSEPSVGGHAVGLGAFASAVIDVIVSPARRRRPRIRVHRAVLGAQERAIVRGIPVTSPTRTLLDLAAVVESRQLERAFDQADVLSSATAWALAEAVARHRGRSGTLALRQLLAKGHGDAAITRSQLEDRFIAVLDAHGLPRPEVNAALELADRWIEADCVWRSMRLVVELDGYSRHGTRAAFERDRARDRALLVAGWRIVRITWRQLNDAPAAVARELTTLLTAPPTLIPPYGPNVEPVAHPKVAATLSRVKGPTSNPSRTRSPPRHRARVRAQRRIRLAPVVHRVDLLSRGAAASRPPRTSRRQHAEGEVYARFMRRRAR